MSQAQKIYDYLAGSKDASTDKALLLGFRLAEEPYSSVVLETALDRCSAQLSSELIGMFHQFVPAHQKLVVSKAGQLGLGLYQAAGSADNQVRFNVLDIIRRSGCCRLADVVSGMLRDHDQQISRHSGLVLLEMASGSANSAMIGSERSSDPETGSGYSDRKYLTSAVKGALKSYSLHRQKEVVLATMYMMPADDEGFWGELLEPFSEVGQSVRRLIVELDDPELAVFCVTALRNDYLRPVAARGISRHKRSAFIIASARVFDRMDDEQVKSGLRLIKKPDWLDSEELMPDMLSEPDQLSLINFVAALGMAPERLADYLAGFANTATASAAEKAMEILAGWTGPAAQGPLCKLLDSPYEKVALAGLGRLMNLGPSNLFKIVAEQLRSPHEQVRRAAELYFRRTAFDSYWKSFDRLAPSQRVAAGRAVFKIDPQAHDRWRRHSSYKNPDDRIKAIRISRILGLTKQHEDVLHHLAYDNDCVVRSCAVSALGELGNDMTNDSRRCLTQAIDDVDDRVRANAIESVRRCGLKDMTDRLSQFAKYGHNRERANAINTLLKWKVKSAKHAIKDMLTDPREQYRRSARLVVKNNMAVVGQ